MTTERKRRGRAGALGAAALICAALSAGPALSQSAHDHSAHDHSAHANHGAPADQGAHAGGHGDHGAAAPADAFESRMNADMEKMMRDMHSPGYTGDRDIDFLAMMIPHHQGAIDMARLALEHGADPLTRQMAEEIIASQQAEIDAMRARLEILRAAESGTAEAEYPALNGLRGEAGGY